MEKPNRVSHKNVLGGTDLDFHKSFFPVLPFKGKFPKEVLAVYPLFIQQPEITAPKV